MTSASFSLFLFNLAVASLLCTAISLLVASLCRSLPNRHASLIVGLGMCLAAPAVVVLGGAFSMGKLPALSSELATASKQKPAARGSVLSVAANRPPKSDYVPSRPVAKPTGGNKPPTTVAVQRSQSAPSRSVSGTEQPVTEPEELLTQPTAEATPPVLGLRATTSIAAALVASWIIGVLYLTICRLRDWSRCTRLIRASLPSHIPKVSDAFIQVSRQQRIRRLPRLLVSPQIPAPAVVGSFRPVVIVPCDLHERFSSCQLRSMFAHELSHITRWDHWGVPLQVLVTTLYWWNPLVWMASRQIAHLRELICDDMALQNEPAPREYAESIIAMAEQKAVVAQLGLSLSSTNEQEQRIRRIISSGGSKLETQLSPRAIAGCVLFALGLTSGIVFAQVPPSQAGQQAQPKSKGVGVARSGKLPEFGLKQFASHRVSGTVVLPDGQPAGRAKVQILGHKKSGIDGSIKADASGRFGFKVRYRTGALGQLRFWAESAEGSAIAFHRFPWGKDERLTEGIEIKLQPMRVAEVEVVDNQQRPIEGASVAAQLKYPNTLPSVATDASGMAYIGLPVTERIEAIVAWKDHAGLDFKKYQLGRSDRKDIAATPPEFPMDRPERLVLEGARPVSVTVVDRKDGKPIPGVEVSPWLLARDSGPDSLNLAFFTEVTTQTTSQTGSAVLAWMPAWQKSAVTVWPSATGYERTRQIYDPSKNARVLQIALDRLVPIRGQVLDSVGLPVEGATVAAHGEGRAMNHFQEATLTDSLGRYELSVAPNQNYILTARDDRSRVSAPHTSLVILSGKPEVNRDFHLRNPTRVHGRLLDERSKAPIPNERVIVYHLGTDLMEIPGANIPNPDKERWSVRPIIQHYANTNAKGEFEFLLGDGSFQIRPPQQESNQEFEIAGQDELEFTVTTKVHAEVELQGFVVAKADSRPIKTAKVLGIPRDFTSSDWSATTDDKGKFRVLRRKEPAYVQAMNQEKTLGCIVEIGALKRTFVIHLEPVGSAWGRLVDTNGQPIAGQRIEYGVDVPGVDSQMFSSRFGGSVVTDDQGEFILESLACNWDYDLRFPSTPDGGIPHLVTAQVKPGESLSLGDVLSP